MVPNQVIPRGREDEEQEPRTPWRGPRRRCSWHLFIVLFNASLVLNHVTIVATKAIHGCHPDMNPFVFSTQNSPLSKCACPNYSASTCAEEVALS